MGDTHDLEKAKEAILNKDYDAAKDICLSALKENEKGLPGEAAWRERLEILLTLTEIGKHLDRLQDNITYLEEFIEGARTINDLGMVAKGLVRTGFVYNRMGKRDLAMQKFNEAEEMARNIDNPVQCGYALAGKANIYWRTGENMKAIDTAKKVLEIGLEHEEHTLTAGAANVIASAHFELANFTEALKAAQMSVEVYRNAGNISDLARALNNQGEIFKRMESYKMAIESYEEGIALLDGRTVKRFGYLYTNLAECHIRLGNLEDAGIDLAKAREVLKDSEDRYAVACMMYVQGLLEAAKSRPEAAIELLRQAEGQMQELGVAYDLGTIRLELTRQLIQVGEKEEARKTADMAIEVLKKAGAVDLVEELKELLK